MKKKKKKKNLNNYKIIILDKKKFLHLIPNTEEHLLFPSNRNQGEGQLDQTEMN